MIINISFEDLDIKFNPLIPNLTINSHHLPVFLKKSMFSCPTYYLSNSCLFAQPTTQVTTKVLPSEFE